MRDAGYGDHKKDKKSLNAMYTDAITMAKDTIKHIVKVS